MAKQKTFYVVVALQAETYIEARANIEKALNAHGYEFAARLGTNQQALQASRAVKLLNKKRMK